MALELARTNGALDTTLERSWTLTLNGILTVSAQMTRKELEPRELLLWERLLENCRIEGLEWAFAEHLRAVDFFPVPAEITRLYATWVCEQNKAKRVAAERRDREETARRRARGETIGIADVLREFNAIVSAKAMPASDPTRRAELQDQKVRIMTAIEKARKTA
jgi:hypothetical protein